MHIFCKNRTKSYPCEGNTKFGYTFTYQLRVRKLIINLHYNFESFSCKLEYFKTAMYSTIYKTCDFIKCLAYCFRAFDRLKHCLRKKSTIGLVRRMQNSRGKAILYNKMKLPYSNKSELKCQTNLYQQTSFSLKT